MDHRDPFAIRAVTLGPVLPVAAAPRLAAVPAGPAGAVVVVADDGGSKLVSYGCRVAHRHRCANLSQLAGTVRQ